MTREKVIFDTDPGVDDAMALLYIHFSQRFDLLGVTTVVGNADVDVTTKNALYLTQRFKIPAPVAMGRPSRCCARVPAARLRTSTATTAWATRPCQRSSMSNPTSAQPGNSSSIP